VLVNNLNKITFKLQCSEVNLPQGWGEGREGVLLISGNVERLHPKVALFLHLKFMKR